MKITIPELSLVMLIGASGSGKSTFARRHFRPTEIVSSDACRALVSDDENNQEATSAAFELVHAITARRLAFGRLTVIDATNVEPESRKPLLALARQYYCLPVAIVFKLSPKLCQRRNQNRPERSFSPQVIRRQFLQLRRSLPHLRREGFRYVYTLSSEQEVDQVQVERVPLWTDKRQECGPFDIIGDVHGCFGELVQLLEKLGYVPATNLDNPSVWGTVSYVHPQGRKAIFLGDLVDRGPRNLDVVRLVRNMVVSGAALCLPGNHEVRLLRKLRGQEVPVTHGLGNTLAELAALPPNSRTNFERELVAFLQRLVSHYVLDKGKLVVAHAGMKETMQGRASEQVRAFALYGETSGETDEFGLPVRLNWAKDYRGQAMVVYGHVPVPEPEWLNNTINVDTGCVFGGKLTALRYPEKELVSVAAQCVYCEPIRPLLSHRPGELSAQQAADDLLDITDVRGKRRILTRLCGPIVIREAYSSAALELISRFAVAPQWLVYLPPTMSPCETSNQPGLLEHPAEAIAYYRQQGVPCVICEEKHMGSRAILIVCRDESAARQRFGITTPQLGIIYTRTGRPFFTDQSLQDKILERLHQAISRAGLWEKLQTTWLCLDAEILPWSAKALELLRQQYAAVGAASSAALPLAIAQVQRTLDRLAPQGRPAAEALLDRLQEALTNAQAFISAYRQYCWPVHSLSDWKIAPFHLLASEGAVHVDKDHLWHLGMLELLCQHAPDLLRTTAYRLVDVNDENAVQQTINWWEDLTSQGGEGVVVKPLSFAYKKPTGLVQPAIKCRGREYLRIIYGPNYTVEANLSRLRDRPLARKRALARAEFALGIEALERFVRGEPLRRVHECVFAILALESEPVDPRL